MKEKYVFKPYSELFPELFSKEKEKLSRGLGNNVLDIQHVGSTSVAGLGGKGIIDIAIAVRKEDLKNISKKLSDLGYIFREIGSAPERLFFRGDFPDNEEETRRYHIHVTFKESSEWKTLLAFRNYLRSHQEIAKQYAELKKNCVKEAKGNGELYRQRKAPFFQEILLKALNHKIFFVIGASGSGKTTVLSRLGKEILLQCSLKHFDSIGIPSFIQMKKTHGSLEEWQRVKTCDWVEKLTKEDLLKSHVIFDAQIRPSFISEACEKYGAKYEVVLFDCSDNERKTRLKQRGHPELADTNMMNWAEFLRNECINRHYKIIDSTHMSVDQTLKQFLLWLENQFL